MMALLPTVWQRQSPHRGARSRSPRRWPIAAAGRDELGDGPAVDVDANALAGLVAPKKLSSAVSKGHVRLTAQSVDPGRWHQERDSPVIENPSGSAGA
jgi:hypothetical protein